MRVQALIYNFLWGRRSGTKVVAKVAWSIVVKPKLQGGLGLVDPLMQSCALMVKFVIRGLLLESDVWKHMLIHQLMQLYPNIGGHWNPSLKWMFLADVKTPLRAIAGDNFLLGIMRAWDAIKKFLGNDMPTTWDGRLNQPLLANGLFRDNSCHVLGMRTRLAWGGMDSGPARSVCPWINLQKL